MAQRAWVATRKGLFEIPQRAGSWAIERVSFLGEPVAGVAWKLRRSGPWKPHTARFGPEPCPAACSARLTRADEVLVGIRCGGVWLTLDDAATWVLRAQGMRATFMPPERRFDPNIQDPHAIARCAAQPDVLWCQHHNGIWRSTDNTASWQEIADVPVSNFGFAVAAHPQQPDTAWFVPAVADQKRVPVDGALVVNRICDGGRSFETLRAGLPQQNCYDLVYRHGLAVDAGGQCLLMGSTTGNLWSSDDGGEHGRVVEVHLPPINAVHIA